MKTKNPQTATIVVDVNLKSYLRLLRLRNLLGYLLIPTFGFMFAQGYIHSLPEVFLFFLITFLYLAFSFAINNCSDVREDKLNSKKKNPIARGELNLNQAIIFSFLLAVLGLIAARLFELKVFLLYLISILLSYSYSIPPLRFKSRLLLDIASHGLFFGAFLFFLPVIIFAPKITLMHYIISFSIFYYSIILELRNHLQDYESDKEANVKTTVCVLGPKRSKSLVNFLILFYPLILLLIFFAQQYFFFFLGVTVIFYSVFLLIKNYRILDAYTNVVYFLLVITILL